MIRPKGAVELLFGLLLIASCRADVRIFVQDSHGFALVEYQCTAGEIVRA